MAWWNRSKPERATEASLEQIVVSGAAGGQYAIDPIDGDQGFRRAGAGDREVPFWTLEKQRAYSVAAYRLNPMARAVIDTYCVDDKTEILTAAGWRRFDDVVAGDEVLTLNHNSGLSEWQSVESMHVFPAQRRTLVRMESRDISALTTANHRWPVLNQRLRWQGKHPIGRKPTTREWRTTETFDSCDSVIRGASPSDAPVDAKWADDLVEMVAWAYTEGHVRPSGALIITQSHVVNSDYCERIEAALRRMYGPPCKGQMRRDRWHSARPPLWQRRDYGRNARFVLNREAAAPILGVAPEKVPSLEWLRTLTLAQLRLFIDVSLMADGDSPGLWPDDRSGGAHFAQLDHRRSEAFALALTLAGIAWGSRVRSNDGHLSISVHKAHATRTVAIRRTAVEHDGIVWCPRTANGTWFARRDGRTYFTGNTSFVVGDSGLSVQCTNDDVRRVVMEFWNDPRNALGDRQELFLRDHLLMGESALEMMVGPMSGVCRFSPIATNRVKEVHLNNGNPLWPLELVISNPNNDDTRLPVAQIDDMTGLRQGDVLWWASWKATMQDRRGQPFLGPILDWLDDFDNVLSNLVDRTALARYLVWDVTVEGADEKELNDFVKQRGGYHVPRSGTIETHNEKVKWDIKTAQSGAAEDTQTTGSILQVVAAGAGLAKHWLADPDNANRATALTMAEPVMRRVSGVQNLWLSYVTDLARYAVDQAVAKGRLPKLVPATDTKTAATVEVPASQTVSIIGPEIAVQEQTATATSLLKLAQALDTMLVDGVLTPKAAKVLTKKAWEQYAGIAYTADLDSPEADPADIAQQIYEQGRSGAIATGAAGVKKLVLAPGLLTTPVPSAAEPTDVSTTT